MNNLKNFVNNNSKRFFIASMCVLSSSSAYTAYQTSERIKYMKKMQIRNIENEMYNLQLKLNNENIEECRQKYKKRLNELETIHTEFTQI
jgi:hypothetical protein